MSSNDNESLNDIIKEMRITHGLSKSTMAERLCMTRQNYDHIESGKTQINPITLHRYYTLFSKELHKKSGFVLDERFSTEEIYKRVNAWVSKIFFGGSGDGKDE